MCWFRTNEETSKLQYDAIISVMRSTRATLYHCHKEFSFQLTRPRRIILGDLPVNFERLPVYQFDIFLSDGIAVSSVPADMKLGISHCCPLFG